MAKRDTVRIGLVGSQFITTIHAEALQMVPQAEVLAVMSPTEGHARDFASKYGIAHHFNDLDAMLAMDEIDMVVVGAPNCAHCEITVKAARAWQARGVRKAAVHEPCRGRSDDRGVPQGGRDADVRGGALLYAQVRQAEKTAG